MSTRSLAVALCAFAVSVSASAQIFTKSLHLTRSIDDPISGTKHSIDEYLIGNRMVSVTGEKTVIVDYGSSQITIINRADSTYSVSTFEQYASSRPAPRSSAAKQRDVSADWKIDGAAPETHAGRMADVVIARPNARNEIASVRIAAARDIELSGDALSALTGSRYPSTADDTQKLVQHAVQRNAAAAKDVARFALPLETTITYDVAGQQLVFKNEVTAVREEEPAPQLVEIPAGAKRVDSPFIAVERELDQLDHPKTNH